MKKLILGMTFFLILTTNFGLSQSTCDIDKIKDAFQAEGCIELMNTCFSDCSMYFLNPQSMTANEAQVFAEGLGGNLVSIHSKAENECLLNALTTLGETGTIWIGLSDEVIEGTFVWYDQSPLDYTNWVPGEPNNEGDNEDCVQIHTWNYFPGWWNDLPCDIGNSKSVIKVNLCLAVNAGPDIAICDGETAVIQSTPTILGSDPYTYEWDNNGPTDYPNSVTPSETTDYILNSADRYGCTSADTMTVTVNPMPTATVGSDITICERESVILTASGDGTWDNEVTDGVPFEPSFTQTYTYTVTLDDCSDTDQLEVIVHPNPIPVFEGDALIGCTPHTVNFTVSNSQPNAICTWDFGDGSSSTACGSVTHTYTSNGLYDVTLTIEGDEGCTITATLKEYIEIINESPIADFTSNPMVIDYNNTEVKFTNTSINATNYIWDFGDYSNQVTDVNPIHVFPTGIEDNYYVTLYASNDIGCVDSTSLLIQIGYPKAKYSIPNVFTPNGDGDNDVFKLIDSENIFGLEVIILNRWGNLVFESDDINFNWNGLKHNKGTECTDGTYFYKINFKDINDEDIEEHGFVQLSRGK